MLHFVLELGGIQLAEPDGGGQKHYFFMLAEGLTEEKLHALGEAINQKIAEMGALSVDELKNAKADKKRILDEASTAIAKTIDKQLAGQSPDDMLTIIRSAFEKAEVLPNSGIIKFRFASSSYPREL